MYKYKWVYRLFLCLTSLLFDNCSLPLTLISVLVTRLPAAGWVCVEARVVLRSVHSGQCRGFVSILVS